MFLGLFVSLTLQAILVEMNEVALFDKLIVLIGELAILVPAILILKQRGVKIFQVLPLKTVSPVTVIMAVVTVLGAIGLVSVFEVIITPYFPIPEFLAKLESNLAQSSSLDILVLVLAGSVAAPIVEEFIFRGILQQSLFYRYGSLLPALVVPTVIFALFHVAYLFYLPALLELLALAFLLAWLMVKTGNLLIPILVHGLFNLSSFASLFMSDLNEISTLSDLGIPWIIITIVFCGAGWFYFKNMQTVVFDEVYLIPPLRERDF